MILVLVVIGSVTFTHQRSGDAVAPAAGGTATYGVQRTAKSGRPLWRDAGCLELTYDAATISPAEAKVIDAAFEAWTTAAASCGQIVATSTRRDRPPAARDELSTVHIRRDRWCNPGNAFEPEVCYAKDAAAVTRLLFIDDPTDPDDGKIIEADIELNAVDFVLLDVGHPAAGKITSKPVLDLLAVATHEAGHALGLAHNCGTGTEAWPTDHAGEPVPSCDAAVTDVRAATMFYLVAPQTMHARSVEPSDTAGVCSIVHSLTCEPVVTGGCSTRRGSAGWLALLAVVSLIRSRRVSASSSSADRDARSRRPSACTRRPRARRPTAG
jgi:hypothetical protein